MRSIDAARAGALLLASLAAGCARDPGPPNVLVVCVDALRADRLGAYGASPSPSPAIDALARDGVVFEDALSVASWTKPSVPSILTGLYPSEHGVLDNSGEHVDTLAAEVPTLAGMLAGAGWRTAAFVENDQLTRQLGGLDRGFDLYVEAAGTAPQAVDRLDAWRRAGDTRPWFAYLHVLDAHFPYAPDAFRLPAAESPRLALAMDHLDQRGEYWWLLRRRINDRVMKPSRALLGDLDRLYRAEVSAVDGALGRLFATLDAEGELDRTLVVVTADHGEGFGERGLVDHGYGPYPELLRVPLVMRLPAREAAGSRRNVLAQNVDIAPTVLEAAGVGVPAEWTSVSLLPAARSGVAVRERAFAEERHGHWSTVGVREGNFLYVSSEDRAPRPPAEARAPEGAAPGTRVRVRGILAPPADARPEAHHASLGRDHAGASSDAGPDGIDPTSGVFVAGSVRRLAPGDPDVEVAGPIARLDAAARTIVVLGLTVRVGEVGDGDDDDLRLADLSEGMAVRVHGRVDDGVVVAVRVEKRWSGPVEIEGVIRGVAPAAGGDLRLDLGGIDVVVDAHAAWKEFPAPPSVAAPAEGASTPRRSGALYDLASDHSGTVDVAALRPAEAARLAAVAGERAAALAVPRRAGRAAIDDDVRERLRAMGYVE